MCTELYWLARPDHPLKVDTLVRIPSIGLIQTCIVKLRTIVVPASVGKRFFLCPPGPSDTIEIRLFETNFLERTWSRVAPDAVTTK
jgi:hypothetical protein